MLEHIFPPRCASCYEIISKKEILCEKCADNLTAHSGLITRGGLPFVAPFVYSGSGRSAVLMLKRISPRKLVCCFAEDIVKQYMKYFNQRPDAVVCVPMSGKKKRRRGFNQSELLGKAVAELLGVKFYRRGLSQVRETKTQHSLPFRAREENVRGAYSASEKLRGKRVLIVDDIITTGATARECAEVLRQAGAVSVTAASAAATPEYKNPRK